MASDGEAVIDLRGKTARTGLPLSAGGMTTFTGAGTGAGRGAGFGAGVGFGPRVALGSTESRGAPGAGAAAGGGAAGSADFGLVAGLSTDEFVESSRSSDWFLGSNDGFDSLDSNAADGLGCLEGTAEGDSEGVRASWGFASRGRAESGLCVLRELWESSLIRDFGKEGSVGVAGRVGRLSACDSSVSGCEASMEGASNLLFGTEDVGSLGTGRGASAWRATGRADLRMLRSRFSIGAYPAVSPRMKLIATSTKPNMAN
jgi:hypothetical protein